MLRRSALLAVLLVFSLPLPARAVLFSDLASQYDAAPVYQGCPATGAGAAQPEVELCQELKTPEEYCHVFHLTKSLENDRDAAAVARACVGFYTRAFESQRLLCDYQKDATALQAAIAANLNNMNGAKDLLGRTALATRCAQKVYSYYRFAAIRQAGVLDKAWSASKKALLDFTDRGAARLKAEAHCQENGVPGGAPGYLLVGVAGPALSDQKKSYDNLAGSLTRFAMAMNAQFTAAEAHTDQVSKRQTNLGEIALVKGMPSPGKSDITGTGSEGDKEPSVMLDGAKGATKDVAKRAGSQAVLDLERASWRTFFQDMFLPAAGHSAVGLARENAGGGVVALGVTYLKEGKVTRGDVVGQVFVGGVSVVAGVLGASAAVTIGLTTGAGMVAERIKADWQEYDRVVQAPYIRFAQGLTRRGGTMTSEEISRRYKAQAARLAYCSKCSLRDEQVGCPGVQGAIHGYNNEAVVPSAGQNELYFNPWVADAYRSYQARYPNGALHSFQGAQNISPISPLPGSDVTP